MCNHYSNDLRKLGRFLSGEIGEQFSETAIMLRFGNLPTQVFPDKPGLVIRQEHDDFVIETMRWGFPKNTDAEGNIEKGATWVTNARHVVNEKSGALYPYWAEWTGPEHRCLVPATSFFEPDQRTVGTGSFKEVEFALTSDEPFFLAGMWRPWNGTRGTKKDPATGDHTLYTFLTTWPNDLIKPVHKQAMPVILSLDDAHVWLNEPIEEAIKLQRQAPDGLLTIKPAAEAI